MVGSRPSRPVQSDGRGLRSSSVAGVPASSCRSRAARWWANPFVVGIAVDSRLPSPHSRARTDPRQDLRHRLGLARNWQRDRLRIQKANADYDLETLRHLKENYMTEQVQLPVLWTHRPWRCCTRFNAGLMASIFI